MNTFKGPVLLGAAVVGSAVVGSAVVGLAVSAGVGTTDQITNSFQCVPIAESLAISQLSFK